MGATRMPKPQHDDTLFNLAVAGKKPVISVSENARQEIKPVEVGARSHNPLRPAKLNDLIGQERMKRLLRRMLDTAEAKGEPLAHTLLVGPSGMGKTTIAHIIANEINSRLFAVEAPVSHETLLDLRESMNDGDVLFIDEIHQQAIRERRGLSTSTQPEVLFNVMEDRTIVTGSDILPFPHITVIGGTTDEGMLPDPFINRFPIRPQFAPYSNLELGLMAHYNAQALKLTIDPSACMRFAHASRGVPRQINNYVRNAQALTTTGNIDEALAIEVLEDLNHTSEDGLNLDMQKTLVFLFTRCKRITGAGETVYQASVNAIATAIGKSRDTKAVALRVEPYLIQQGLLSVGHGGRRLTDEGVKRATDLYDNGVRA